MGTLIFIVVSTGHFDPLIEACSRLHDKYEFVGQIGSSQVEPPFSYFRTASPSQLESYMERSELVITHAGTGMLSMLYTLRKKCVVIPKQMRYGEANDGQVELARKWDELGIGVLCLDLADLSTAIKRCRQLEPTFPSFPSVGRALRQELLAQPPLKGAVLSQ